MKKSNEFQSQLQTYSSDELCLFIMSLYAKNKDIVDDFVIWESQYQYQYQQQEENQSSKQATAQSTLQSLPADKKVIHTIHNKIDKLLIGTDEHDYTYYGELVFDEQVEGFEELLTEFQQQPSYLIATATYWIDQLITHYDDYLWETDLENSLSTAYATIAEVTFDAKDYDASWEKNFYPYQSRDKSHASQSLTEQVATHINDWLANVSFTDNIGRLWFDFLVATGQTEQAMAWLDDCIHRLTINTAQNSYSDYKLRELLLLKLQFLQHLDEDKRAETLITDYIYIKDIRDVRIRTLLVEGKIDKAIALIEEGIQQSDSSYDIKQWRQKLVEIAEEHHLIDVLIKNSYQLAFNNHSYFINTEYYAKWKACYTGESMEKWQSIRESEQNRLRKSIGKSADKSIKSHLNRSALRQLAQFYDLEKQYSELVGLIKQHPEPTLIDTYLEIIANHADNAFIQSLIQQFTIQWNSNIDRLSTRKAYAEQANEISKTVKRLPQGAIAWQNMVAKWKENYRRKPALLDELSKIKWA